jgi:hypothetical protein
MSNLVDVQEIRVVLLTVIDNSAKKAWDTPKQARSFKR